LELFDDVHMQVRLRQTKLHAFSLLYYSMRILKLEIASKSLINTIHKQKLNPLMTP